MCSVCSADGCTADWDRSGGKKGGCWRALQTVSVWLKVITNGLAWQLHVCGPRQLMVYGIYRYTYTRTQHCIFHPSTLDFAPLLSPRICSLVQIFTSISRAARSAVPSPTERHLLKRPSGSNTFHPRDVAVTDALYSYRYKQEQPLTLWSLTTLTVVVPHR